MSRAEIVRDAEGRFLGVTFRCPGCGDSHMLGVHWRPPGSEVSPHQLAGPHWGFNGDFERPTFTPSILARSGHYDDQHTLGDACWCTWEGVDNTPAPFSCGICHSFVTDGRIQFLSDCTHALAGTTVDLPALPAEGVAP